MQWGNSKQCSVQKKMLRRRVEVDQNHLPTQLAGTMQSSLTHNALQKQPTPDRPSRRQAATNTIIQENCGHPWIPEGPKLTTVNIAASGNLDPERRLCPNLPSASQQVSVQQLFQACVPGGSVKPLWQAGSHLQTQWFGTKAVARTTKIQVGLEPISSYFRRISKW